MTKKTINTIEDIKLLVDTFYSSVRNDDLLGPIFNDKIQDNWEKHLDKMYCFWETILLDNHTYYGSPFLPHMKLPIEQKHFTRWLSIFEETVDTNFEGKRAEEAKWRAQKMAEMFVHKIEYSRKNSTKSLL